MGAFYFHFGNFKLAALRCTNLSFVDIVLLTGVLGGRGTLTEVHGEVRAQEESREVVLAHVAWVLDNAAGSTFIPAISAPWLDEGRAHRHLLSWVRERREYKEKQALFRARPHCVVARDWMRVGISTLRDFVAHADPTELITVAFDGEALSFRAPGLTCIMAAQGEQWPEAVRVQTERMLDLPKRLEPTVVVGLWEGALTIGRNNYPLS
jgi:hypothetical protein